MNKIRFTAAGLMILTLFSCSREPSLIQGFHHPPESTKPWVYWYWITDNISREGITRDLEAMASIGIGEAFIGNIHLENTVQGSVKALTPEWWEMVEHAVREGGRLGVNIGLFNCPGWSQSGGPWIPPEKSMRYVTYSETRVKGPMHFQQRLPAPAASFQDIAVLAFPTPQADDDGLATYAPEIRTVPAVASVDKWFDADPNSAASFQTPDGQTADTLSVEISLLRPMTARSLSIYPGPFAFKAECDLQVQSEGGSWRSVKQFAYDRSNPSVQVGPIVQGAVVETFSAQTGREFRVLFHNIRGKAGLAEIHLSAAARVERYVEKQLGKMFSSPQPLWDAYLWPRPQEPEAEELIVSPGQVRNISNCLQADGILTWDVPEGEWILLRTGMAPTGVQNSPASPEATGLEVDKMNHLAAEHHFNAYVGELLKRLPPDQRRSLTHIVADSYEMGSQNWTDDFRQAFIQQYGYDPVMWLPVLSGRIIASAEQSDRFLWDIRRLVADRVAQEYVGGLAQVAHAHKLKLWLENYGHWGFPGEFLQYGAKADHLSGEFWATGDLGSIELRAASSASHIYGMPVVSAEAFTGGPAFVSHPYALKKRGDWAYAEGINHFVLHVYIHQPWEDRKPGMNAWFGTEFNRHNTWFAQSKSWIDYLRRCHFLLQQGNPVADIAYLIGEDTPKMTGARHPALPLGYDYDYINSETILHRLRVKDHRLVLPNGTSYAVLVLPDRDTMRPELLEKIVELTAAGATVLGAPPSRSPSMKEYPACDRAVQELAAKLWESCDGETQHRAPFQQGRVYRNVGLDSLLRDLGLTADFFAPEAPEVLYTHKRAGGVDIYFLTNQSERSLSIEPLFRVHGKQPELWNPVTGETILTARFLHQAQGTRVRLQLEPRGSLFVVFQKNSAGNSTVTKTLFNGEETDLPVRFLQDGMVQFEAVRSGSYQLLFSSGQKQTCDSIRVPSPLTLTGPWQVRFLDGGAALQSVSFDSLFSWTDHPDANIKYYSGTAVYEKTFYVSSIHEKEGETLLLDLGDVGVIAQVAVNGHPIAELWKPPFAVAVGPYLHDGSNHLRIEVTNVWKNRLIGGGRDAQKRLTSAEPYLAHPLRLRPEELLMPSGLIGPVRLLTRLGVKVAAL